MITAQYKALCHGDCGHPIEPGQQIEHRGAEGGWQHAACPESVADVADRAALDQPRCAHCGLNHAGEC